MERVSPIVARKARFGVDASGTTDAAVRDIVAPIEALFDQEFPRYQPFPFGARRQIAQLVRHILLAEPLVEEWG